MDVGSLQVVYQHDLAHEKLHKGAQDVHGANTFALIDQTVLFLQQPGLAETTELLQDKG